MKIKNPVLQLRTADEQGVKLVQSKKKKKQYWVGVKEKGTHTRHRAKES